MLPYLLSNIFFQLLEFLISKGELINFQAFYETIKSGNKEILEILLKYSSIEITKAVNTCCFLGNKSFTDIFLNIERIDLKHQVLDSIMYENYNVTKLFISKGIKMGYFNSNNNLFIIQKAFSWQNLYCTYYLLYIGIPLTHLIQNSRLNLKILKKYENVFQRLF